MAASSAATHRLDRVTSTARPRPAAPTSLAERPARAIDLLRRVRLPDPVAILRHYPHELSGAQQQRVAIAMALAGEPVALLLDEPTTGLDVTTQAHILELLHDLAHSTGTAMVYVSHDLGAIARVCARVVVMYAGEIVLEGDATAVLTVPARRYARGLLAAIPGLDEARLPMGLDGSPPAPGQAAGGCAFADRCALVERGCAKPALFCWVSHSLDTNLRRRRTAAAAIKRAVVGWVKARAATQQKNVRSSSFFLLPHDRPATTKN